jgi:acetyl-CoA carboxylase carboxyl transferase subunit beta
MPLFRKKYSTVKVDSRGKERIPEGFYVKDPLSQQIIYSKELEQNLMVVPQSGYHFPLSAPARIKSLVDEASFHEADVEMKSSDPLKFRGVSSYSDKLSAHSKKTGLNDPVVWGVARMGGAPVSLAVMDFRFLGASMGSVAGEKITRAIEYGVDNEVPVIVVCSSGGARMYEGILSLMQMAKTGAALGRLAQKGIPYFAVPTNPTMAGVMASFASLGDLILAEPGALIGFAGPRVIKETTQQELPDGFQTSEFLLDHGLLDQIVERKDLRNRLIYFMETFGYGAASAVTDLPKKKPTKGPAKRVAKKATAKRRKA